jgi:tRNA A-37 threonylcarbamoyl transferase component Bud32
MRFLYRPSVEERSALQERLSRFRQPAAALEVLASILPVGFRPSGAICTECSVHPDRFVVRAQVRSAAGEQRDYALKVYADDFAERVWAYARKLAPHVHALRDGLCLPIHHLPQERMLVFPWVEGRSVADIADSRAPALLRRTAALAAALHRCPVVPEPPTTPAMILDETRDRCRRLRERCPGAVPIVAPLLAELEDAATGLDPAAPAPVHGDLDVEQIVWTGERLVLVDLDMFGYTDPAYDVGHFLGQLERRGAPARWLTAFRDAYVGAVSARNVAFYRSVTLVRKIHTVCRLEPSRWQAIVPRLASRALAVLREVPSPVQVL